MLVNHPNMSLSDLPTDDTIWHTLPTTWGITLVDRMGEAMQESHKSYHWYAKLDGYNIHIRKSKFSDHYWIETLPTEISIVAEAIRLELQNGIVTEPDEEKQRYFVGDTFTCVDGTILTVHEVKRTPYYECFMGSDGIWRYDRANPYDNGRPTGTRTFPPDPKHVAEGHPLKHPRKVMEALEKLPDFGHHIRTANGRVIYDTSKSVEAICRILDHLFEVSPQQIPRLTSTFEPDPDPELCDLVESVLKIARSFDLTENQAKECDVLEDRVVNLYGEE